MERTADDRTLPRRVPDPLWVRRLLDALRAMAPGSLASEQAVGALASALRAQVTVTAPGGRTLAQADAREVRTAGGVSLAVPLEAGGQPFGRLRAVRPGPEFDPEEQLLAEWAALCLGRDAWYREVREADHQARQTAAVQAVLDALSFSERAAIGHVLEALGGTEGLVVASRVADRAGITRSVIVNALRKLESAGMLESRSLGMKGTYLRIRNDGLLDLWENHRTPTAR